MKSKKLVSVQPEMLKIVDQTDLQSLDYNALVELGKGVSEVKVYSQWLLGKLGDAVVDKNKQQGSTYGNLIKYAKDVGQIYGVLQQYVNTYRKYTREDPDFSPDKYFGSVPWGMLQMIAMKSDKPVSLLNELVDKGVHSFDHAYREIKTKQTGQIVPKKPKVGFVFSDDSKKWRIKLEPKDFDLIDWANVKEQLIIYLQGLS